MSDGNGALPEGWEEATGDDLFQFVRGVSYKKAEAFYEPTKDSIAVLRAGNLQDGRVILEDLVHVPPDKVRDDQRLLKGDLVIAMSSGSASIVGKVAVVTEDMPRVAFGAFCGLMRPRSSQVEHWLGEYFQTLDYRNFISDIAAGVNINNLRRQHLQELSIRVPPPPEMERLESKIESLQERSSRARRALSEVGPLLEQFRQSVLRAAFSGRLTADWRAAHRDVEPATELLSRIRTERRHRWEQSELAKYEAKNRQPPRNWQDKYKEPEPIDASELPALPEGWCWTRLDDIAADEKNAIKAGPFGSSLKKSFYVESGYKIYGQEQVINGDPYFGDYYIDDEKYESLRSCAVKPGDLLISLVGTIGRTLVLPDDIEPGIINPRLIKITLDRTAITPPFLQYYFRAPQVLEIFSRVSHGGTMEILNMGTLKALAYPLPPLAEQEAIVRQVEDAIGMIASVTEDVAESESSLTQLDQSILAKAFRGELVPQDPRDEPASELLARIRTTREATPAKPRRKKSARRKPKDAADA